MKKNQEKRRVRALERARKYLNDPNHIPKCCTKLDKSSEEFKLALKQYRNQLSNEIKVLEERTKNVTS